MSNYNGWYNYETWRTNLELFDGSTPEDHGVYVSAEDRDENVEALANSLEQMAYEVVEEQANGWALDLAQSFLARVEWTEIAEHMVDNTLAEMN